MLRVGGSRGEVSNGGGARGGDLYNAFNNKELKLKKIVSQKINSSLTGIDTALD